MIATAADHNPEAMDAYVKELQEWIKLSGVVKGVGVTDISNIQHNQKLLSEVYKMGKSI